MVLQNSRQLQKFIYISNNFLYQLVDPNHIVLDNIKRISSALDDTNFPLCASISNNLVRFAWNMKLEEPLYIGEILEASFGELAHALTRHLSPNAFDKAKNNIKNELREPFLKIMDAYTQNNSIQLHESLVRFRFIATTHQLNIMVYGDKKW
ncbi:MAG: hypothetical protein K8823_1190 [Cenarchaeum symbiont of Oopsacas minuta]|nr:hypothetical protein [Cenarchaeum symbiont of Oopsacas minuta]